MEAVVPHVIDDVANNEACEIREIHRGRPRTTSNVKWNMPKKSEPQWDVD
jgi:hypothetical protein